MAAPSNPLPADSLPVILIGGLAMAAAEFALLEKALAAKGVHSFSFDNLLAGKGPRPATASIDAQATHAWDVLDAVMQKGRHTLFGLSMGGMIAATMAAMRPERVATVFLAATSTNSEARPAIPDAYFNALTTLKSDAEIMASVAAAFGPTAREKKAALVAEYCRHRLNRGNGQTGRDFFGQVKAIRAFAGEEIYARLRVAKVDTVTIAGAEDALFSAPHMQRVAEAANARAALTMKKTGHMLHLENPEALAALIAGHRR